MPQPCAETARCALLANPDRGCHRIRASPVSTFSQNEHDRDVPLAVRSSLIVFGAAVAAVCTWVLARRTWLATPDDWSPNRYDQIAMAGLIVAIWSLFAGAVWLYRWRPAG